MKVVKTDGILATTGTNRARIETAGGILVEQACLTEDALIGYCAEAVGLLVLREPITARVIRSLPRCRAITRFGIGVDMIDLDAAAQAGIVVTNVPDANVEEVACHAVAMALALGRRLPDFDSDMRAMRWTPLSTGRGMLRPTEQVFGLVGLGRIGRLVVERIRPFGFRIVAHDPSLPSVAGVEMMSLDDVIRTADIVSLHVPFTPQNANMLDARRLGAMKPGAILINVARGGLVDEAALADALAGGHLGGAGIDTFATEPIGVDNPLLGAPNLLLSPHVAHYSEQSLAEMCDKAFADMGRILRGEAPVYPVLAST